jgi:hypothetical protein
MENNALTTIKQEGFFRKIRNFFIGLFKHQKDTDISQSNTNQNLKNETLKTNYENEKKEIFDLLSKIKNREIDVNTLNQDQLNKVGALLKEEIRIKEKKVNELTTEINIYKFDIKNLKQELN